MASRYITPLTIAGVGLIAISAAVYGLDAWRDGRRGSQIDYVLKNAREVATDGSSAITDGDLVVAVDVALPDRDIVDPDLGFGVEALRYSRDAEILQWKETEHTRTTTGQDGSRVSESSTYTYSKEWSDRTINSSSFHNRFYSNHGMFPFNDQTFRPDSIRFGAFKLDKSFDSFFPVAKKLHLTREMFDAMTEQYRSRFALVDGGLFPDRNPQIGDIRVQFSAVLPEQATVVGAYRDGVIVPAETEAGTIAMYRVGNLSLEGLAEEEKSDSRRISMILLVIAGLIGFVGAACMAAGIVAARSKQSPSI